jgi:hypothetical protein
MGKAFMKLFAQHFGRVHVIIFLAFVLVFSVLTLWSLASQSPSDWRNNQNAAATLLAVTGPFTGAIARNFQSCCLNASLALFPWCLAILVLGAFCQFVPLPFRRGERFFRIGTWVIAMLGWFAGTVLSLAHALG